MAAKDIYHDACVRALEKDGWTITHDPLTIPVDGTNLLVDVGAERVVTAERAGERIAVEIKSFVSLSAVQDLKVATGQFFLYELALHESTQHADRVLYLAIRKTIYDTVFQTGVGKLAMRSNRLRLIVFDTDTEEITEWVR
jgi:hypothetical protein